MTKNIVPNPHDRFFRGSLSDPRVSREFMETHLPAHIKALVDLNTLEMCSGTFVDEILQLHLSDVLFSVKWKGGKPGYIYTLLEHQRDPEDVMPFRALQYKVKIMDQHYKEHGELPIVYTLVIYNGKRKYPYSTDLFDLFGEHRSLAEQTLLTPFDLLDLSQIPDEDLKQKMWSGMMELSLKHSTERDLVPFIKSLIQMIRRLEQAGGAGYVRTAFHYLFLVGEIRNAESLKQVIHNQLSPQLEENVMTIAELFRQEGRQIGKQIGKQIGHQEAMQEVASRLLQRDVSDDEIAALTGLSLEAIQTLKTTQSTH